ncbi:MAG: hypothetical protein KDA28_15670, partial [Phycisphaerales bacterium]|nr:hypothetical protein [Phycisphaerales bacterium]
MGSSTQHTLELDATVTSASGTRDLVLEDAHVLYEMRGDPGQAGLVRLSPMDQGVLFRLEGTASKWMLDADGELDVGDLTLEGDASIRFGLMASNAPVQASVRLAYGPERDDHIDFRFSSRLDHLGAFDTAGGDGLDPFGLPGFAIRVRVERPHVAGVPESDQAWRLAFDAVCVHAWSDLADHMGALLSPGWRDMMSIGDGGVPDFFGAVRFTLQDGGDQDPATTLATEFRFVDLSSFEGDDLFESRPPDWTGRLGPLPIEVSHASMSLAITTDGSDATLDVGGSAEVTTFWDEIGAQSFLPQIVGGRFEFRYSDRDLDGSEPDPQRRLRFRFVDEGDDTLLRLPSPLDGSPVDLAVIQELVITLDESLAMRASLAIPTSFEDSVFELFADMIPGTSDDDLLRELQKMVGSSQVVFSLRIPIEGDDDVSFEVRIAAPDDVGWIDPFAFVGLTASGTSTPDPEEAWFRCRPSDLRFRVVLGDEPEIMARASMEAVLFDETFDAAMFMGIRGGIPEARLGVGYDDPVDLRIPGLGDIPPIDWSQIASNLGLDPSATGMIEQV